MREWLAASLVLVLATTSEAGALSAGGWVGIAFTALAVGVALAVGLRLGLLALSVAVFVALLSQRGPLTLDWSAWYAGRGVAVFLVVVFVAAYGFGVTKGDRPLLGEGFFGGD